MARRVLLGIDIGTSQLKVGAFDPSGRLLSLRRRPTPVTRLGPEAAEHDAEALWTLVRDALAETAGSLPEGAETVSIGVSSFGESGVLVDAQGGALAPVAAWYDVRPEPVYRAWARSADLASVRRQGGLHADASYGAFKLAWLLRERPELAPEAVAWLSVADWVAFRLTGRLQFGACQAARTLALDLRTLDWAEEPIAGLGLPRELFPEVRAPGRPVGRISEDAAAQTKLAPTTVVGDTGHDQVLAALGAGGAPGRIVDSCGTAEALLGFVPARALDRVLAVPDVAVGPHALPGQLTVMASVRASGSVVDWAVRTLARGGALPGEAAAARAQAAAPLGAADYERATRCAEAAGAGASGTWFVPHLRGASDAPGLSVAGAGHFGGIRETTTAGDMLRAVLEGVSLEGGRHLALVLDALGADAEGASLVAVGGPTRNALWMQLKADVFGRPVQVLEPSEGALWGAALAGALGAGMELPPPGSAAMPAEAERADAEPSAAAAGRRYAPGPDAPRYRELALAYAERVALLRSVP